MTNEELAELLAKVKYTAEHGVFDAAEKSMLADMEVVGTALQSLIATAREVEALRAENARLRETVDAVWKEATTMRNASKLVGPYPTEPSKHRVWARSMYHAGKKLHEIMKPIRALKENPNEG